MRKAIFLSFVQVLFASAAFAQPAAVPKKAPAFPQERSARIDRLLQQYVDQNKIPGAVALVLRDGETVYERAVGWSDKEAWRRMTASTIFRIASQTKAITSPPMPHPRQHGKTGLKQPARHSIPTLHTTRVA